MKHTLRCLTVVAAVMASGTMLAQQSGSLPRIRVLATGGTIAGAQASATDYGYKSGAYDVNSLLKAVPNLDKLAVITGEQVASIGSQDMNDEIWLKLAKRVNEVLKSADADGILITHGTDTLEETSYFLSLVTKSDKPVVMVGSMRPATAISADGPGNIYGGVAVVADPRARGKGTLVYLNDKIHYARNVVKTDTTSVQTFNSIHRGPAGVGPYEQGRMVRADGSQAGQRLRVLGRQARQAAAGRRDLRAREHERRPDRRRGSQRGAGHRHRRRGRRQHDGTSRSMRSPRRPKPASSSCAAPGCRWASCCETTRSTMTSWDSWRRVS